MSNERSPRGLCSTTIGTRGMGGILSTTVWLSHHHSNHLVVKGAGHGDTARDRDRGEPRGGLGGARDRGGPRGVARGRARAGAARRDGRGAAPARLVVVDRGRARDARGGARRRGAGWRARGRGGVRAVVPAAGAGSVVRARACVTGMTAVDVVTVF